MSHGKAKFTAKSLIFEYKIKILQKNHLIKVRDKKRNTKFFKKKKQENGERRGERGGESSEAKIRIIQIISA